MPVITTLARLSDGILIGAGVTYGFDTAENPSESGVTGTKAMRDQVVRQYMVSLRQGNPAVEFQALMLAARGGRYPFEVKDWANNYQATAEVLDPALYTTVGGSTEIKLYRKFTPTVGSLSYSQRILCPDASVSITLNGNVLPHGGVSATIAAPGIVTVDTVLDPGTDVLSWTGPYYVPVRLMDAPTGDIVDGLDSSSGILFEFKSVRLKEILEAELSRYVT